MEQGDEDASLCGNHLEKNQSDDVLISTETLLRLAVEYLADAFDGDEPVDGAGMVEWFGQWRQQAKHALEVLQRSRVSRQ